MHLVPLVLVMAASLSATGIATVTHTKKIGGDDDPAKNAIIIPGGLPYPPGLLRNLSLRAVPELFFLGNLSRDVRSLDLSRNVIKAINGSAFRTLVNLQVLDLSCNEIGTLNASFRALTALKTLDLSVNRLTSVDRETFAGLRSLQQLNLSRNLLEALDEMCFSGLQRLQQLDMSWNRLARVNPGTLQLPSLARLLLAGNPTLGASPEPGLLVGTGRRLQTVDVSRTGLVQVPAALTHSVRTLRLAGNAIRSVNCGDLDSYPLLQLLDLSSNELRDIEEDALGRLDALSILYLSDNKLRSIPLSLPDRSLRIVHLERNGIEEIRSADFQGLAHLEVLLLNDNNVTVIHEKAFNHLLSLATLDLSRNPLRNIPAGALQGPLQLQVLRLSGMRVKDLGAVFPLLTPEYLVTLDLSRSPELAATLLQDAATLAALRELQELDVRGCRVSELRSDLRHFLPQLRALHIADNPLNCTGLSWLGRWMRKQDRVEYGSVMCAAPAELAGTLLIDLPVSISQETTTTTTTTTTTSTITVATERAAVSVNSINSNSNNNNVSNVTGLLLTAEKAKKKEEVFYERPETTMATGVEAATTTTTTEQTVPTTVKMTTAMVSTRTTQTSTEKPTKATNAAWSSSSSSGPTATTPKMKRKSIILSTVTAPVSVSSASGPEANRTREFSRAAAVEMSPYSDERDWDTTADLTQHPGMLVLALGILLVVTALGTLASRVARRRRVELYSRQQDIEVSSITGVAPELW